MIRPEVMKSIEFHERIAENAKENVEGLIEAFEAYTRVAGADQETVLEFDGKIESNREEAEFIIKEEEREFERRKAGLRRDLELRLLARGRR